MKVCWPHNHWNYQKEFGRNDGYLKKGTFLSRCLLIVLIRQTFLGEFWCDSIPVFSVPVERKKPVNLSRLTGPIEIRAEVRGSRHVSLYGIRVLSLSTIMILGPQLELGVGPSVPETS